MPRLGSHERIQDRTSTSPPFPIITTFNLSLPTSQHAVRVLELVGLTSYFEGIVSCDYGAPSFSCKPEQRFFDEALSAISSPSPPVSSLYFVDDSALNVKGANALGWGHCVLFDERGDEAVRLGGLEKVPLQEEKGEAARVSVISDMTGALSGSFSLQGVQLIFLPLQNFEPSGRRSSYPPRRTAPPERSPPFLPFHNASAVP